MNSRTAKATKSVRFRCKFIVLSCFNPSSAVGVVAPEFNLRSESGYYSSPFKEVTVYFQ